MHTNICHIRTFTPTVRVLKQDASSGQGIMSRTDTLPWVEKYRPHSLDGVVGNDGVVSTIREFVKQRQIPHLLFYGPPGTGKTSTIVAVAREIFGDNYRSKILELNASDDRGIDVVREQIKTFASTRQMFSKPSANGLDSQFKLVVLDEADAMTNVAQNALRRIIEKYSAHTRFCILANYTHKLNPALISRCTRFRFTPVGDDAVYQFLKKIVHEEKLDISQEALDALVKLSQGDMRRNINVLQACAARVEGTIEASDVYACVGSPDPRDIETIVHSMLHDQWGQCLELVTRLKRERGLALADVLSQAGDLFIDVELDSQARAKILSGLADVEYRLSSGGSEKLQTTAMIGVVQGNKA